MVWPVTPWPTRPASISTTRAPASWSRRAAVTPTIPAPTTHTSAVTSASSGANSGVAGAVSSERNPSSRIPTAAGARWHWFFGGTVTAMTAGSATRRRGVEPSRAPAIVRLDDTGWEVSHHRQSRRRDRLSAVAYRRHASSDPPGRVPPAVGHLAAGGRGVPRATAVGRGDPGALRRPRPGGHRRGPLARGDAHDRGCVKARSAERSHQRVAQRRARASACAATCTARSQASASI